MDKVLKRYAFQDWDSVLASVGHGGLKEGQVINKMIEERTKKLKREVTDATILDAIGDNNKPAVVPIKGSKSKSGITVNGIHDLAGPFLQVLQPGSGRRDRWFRDERPRNYDPQNGLYQRLKSPGD